MRRHIGAAAGQGIAFALQLCMVAYIARALGPGVQGEFATLRSVVFVGEALIWLGLNSGTSYLIAKDPLRYLKSLVRVSLWHLLVGCLAVLFVGLVAGRYAPRSHWMMDLLRAHLLGTVSWLFFQGTLQLTVRTLLATRLYYWANVVSSSNAGIGLLLVLLLPGSLNLEAAINSQIMASVISSLFGAFLIRRKSGHFSLVRGLTMGDWTSALRAGTNGLVSTMAFMALYRIDLLLVATFCDKRTSGIYAVASFATEALQRSADWFAAVLTPLVASNETDGHREARRNSLVGVGIVLAGVLACSGAIMAGLNPFTLGLGTEFSGSATFALALLPKACIHCVMVSYAAVLAGRGYTIYHPMSGGAAVAVLIILGITFGPVLGPGGVIISLTAAYLVAAAIMIIGVRKTRYVHGA